MAASNMYLYLAATICTFALSIGQLLFKASARRLTATSPTDPNFLALLGSALLLYGIVSIAWVLILQRIELSRAYPLMALSFVLVPLGEAAVFKQAISPQYFVGAMLIVAGIVYIGVKGN